MLASSGPTPPLRQRHQPGRLLGVDDPPLLQVSGDTSRPRVGDQAQPGRYRASQRASVIVGKQLSYRLGRATAVGADDAAWSALDSSR